MKILFSILFFSPISSWAFLSPPQYVSLFPKVAYDFQQSGLNLNKICIGENKKIDDKFMKCIKDHMPRKVWEIYVYENPEKASKVLGEILVTAEAGGDIYAEYSEYGKGIFKFPNDSGAEDTENTNFFLYTVSDIKGDWIQLPKRPFPKPVWINIKKDWPKEETAGVFTWFEGGMYYSKKLGDFVVRKIGKDKITYRKANYQDGICDEGQGPTEEQKKITDEDMKLREIPVKDLFDSDGHLLAWPSDGIDC